MPELQVSFLLKGEAKKAAAGARLTGEVLVLCGSKGHGG